MHTPTHPICDLATGTMLVSCSLEVFDQVKPTVLDGNSLFSVMGPFLFDGVVRCTRAGHEAGKAEAIAALCKVRVSPSH